MAAPLQQSLATGQLNQPKRAQQSGNGGSPKAVPRETLDCYLLLKVFADAPEILNRSSWTVQVALSPAVNITVGDT